VDADTLRRLAEKAAELIEIALATADVVDAVSTLIK
jgi:hypothetical protein